MTGLRERKKRRTRELLAQSAVELIGERGLDGVSVADICENVEVSRSTFFRYFDSKESAFVEGLHSDRLHAVLAALAERPLTESPLVAAHHALQSAFEDWEDHQPALELDARIRRDSPSLAAWAAASARAWEAAATDVLAARFDDDEAGALRARVLASMVMSAIQIASTRRQAGVVPEPPAKHLTAVFEAIADIVHQSEERGPDR